MALVQGSSAIWSDIDAIYDNLRTAQSNHGLAQTAKPYTTGGGIIEASNIKTLNDGINSLSGEGHLASIQTGVPAPAVGIPITADLITTMAEKAAQAAAICHNNSFNSFGANPFYNWNDSCFCIAYSKKELKENIHQFSQSALDLIKDLQIVDFNYKDDQEKNYKVGFIADDTNEIFATKHHDRMDMYNCIGVLLKAVQELNKKIDALQE